MSVLSPPRQPAVPGDPGPQPTAALPSWGTVVDLTPPEVLVGRRVRTVRRLVVTLVAVVLAACVGGYLAASWSAHLAAQDLAGQQTTTQGLLQQQRSYAGVVQLQGDIADIQRQVAQLMGTDVDVAALLGKVQGALPAGNGLTQVQLTIDPTTGAGASGPSGQSGAQGGAAVLDASGAQHIGTLTLTGTGHALTDVPAYLAKLRGITGLYGPYPLSNQTLAGGTTWSVQVTLTGAALSHRFALPTPQAGGTR